MDRLAGAFRDAPLGMALVAPGGAFLRVNSTLCRMLGRTEPELLAESLADVVEDERVAQALRDGEASVQIETPMRHREGRPVVALVSATLVRDIRGEPQYYVCQVLDMTERYEAQADLAANEAKLAEAQQIARHGLVGVGDRLRPRHLVRRALSHLRRDGRRRAGVLRVLPRQGPRRRPRPRRARHRDGRDRAPAVEPRLPHHPPRRRAAHDPRARRGRRRRERASLGGPRHLPGRDREPPRRGPAARRRAALPPRLRRRPDRHGAHRPRRPLAAPEPLAVPDARPQRAAAAHDRAQRAQPSRGPPPGPPADQGAAGRAPALVRDREALPARRRDHGPRARAHLAHARRRRAPSVLPLPAGRHHRAPPRRGRAPGQRGAPAGDHRQLAGAHHRQGPPAPLPARQPPLGGALRRARRPGRGAHRARRPCPPRAGPTTSTSTIAWPRTASPTRR